MLVKTHLLRFMLLLRKRRGLGQSFYFHPCMTYGIAYFLWGLIIDE